MGTRAHFQAACFTLQTIFGGLVTIFANMVMNTGSMVSAASVVASSLLTLVCMGLLELVLDVAMDAAGEPRLVAVRRFTGRPRDVVANALLTGSGIVLISYSLRTDRTPLPLQVMIQLLMNLLITPAKVALVNFDYYLPLFSWLRTPSFEVSAQARLDARRFWTQYAMASTAFIAATLLTSIDRNNALAASEMSHSHYGELVSDGASASSDVKTSVFTVIYSLGVFLMSLAQIHADATLSGAEKIAAQLTRRSTQPSKLELMKQGLNFGTTKQFWRFAVALLMLPASLHIPGLDTASVDVNETSIRHTFFAIFSLQSASVVGFVIVLTLQAFLEPLINAEDASLNAASQNTQSVLLIALAWVPSLTNVTAGYRPSVYLTLPALLLVGLGSVPLGHFSAIVQRYHHGEIATAPDEEAALRLVEKVVAVKGSRPGSLWDLDLSDERENLARSSQLLSNTVRNEERIALDHPVATTGVGLATRAFSPVSSRTWLPDGEPVPAEQSESTTLFRR